MYRKTLEENTERVLAKIVQSGLAENFYLAGGTALALQLGHRKSEDLDWFSPTAFSADTVKKKLSELGAFELTGEEDGTIHGVLDGVRISFLRYEYPMLFPFVDFENAHLADERDIAAMKIDAVSSRGSKKDFIDLYVLLEKYSFSELLGFFEGKYSNIQFNRLHILKSMVFFEDAETDPMPVMLKEVNWEMVKQSMRTTMNSVLETQP